jgi:hypothetical protein
MAQPVAGVTIAIHGTSSPELGCSCEHHVFCGTVVYVDILIRFKKTTVEAGTCVKMTMLLMSHFSIVAHFLTFSSGANQHATVLGAYWVTEGADRCLVGRVSDEFKDFFNQLEGRIAQVVEIYSRSASPKKMRYSTLHDGVCHAILVDRAIDGDIGMNQCLTIIDSDDSDNESD